MKDSGSDIEKLFRDSFESYEADVDPSVWDAIADKIGAQPNVQDPSSASSSAGAGGGAASSISIAKIAIIAAASGILSFGAYSLFSEDEEAIAVKKDEIANQIEEPKSVQEKITAQEALVSDSKDTAPVVKEEASETSSKEIVTTEELESKAVEKPTEEKSNTQKAIAANESEKKSQKEAAKDNTIATAAPVLKEEQNESKSVQDQTPEERIEEMDNFEASIYSSVTSGKEPLEVRFENRGSMAAAVRWIVDNEEEYYQSSIRHTFESSGDYWVYLEIESENGRKSRDSVMISVQGSAYINVPNVFTPNGDGNNDAFMVETNNIGDFKCEIYDRSGRLVYHWENIHGHWDGKDIDGRQLQEGVYLYMIQATDANGNTLELKKGTVTLFR